MRESRFGEFVLLHVLVVFAASLLMVWGQDLQFGCLSCGDLFDKCEIDCSWSLQGLNVSDVVACQADCLVAKNSCDDSSETMVCSLCTLGCSETYDLDMRACLVSVGRETKSTFGDGLSECELLASFDMDSCMLKCKKNHDNLDDEYDV
jgi:hypothetical protein